MASKFGKILTFTAIVSAATAGVLYFLHTRSEKTFDDFDDFDEDFDTDSSAENSSREYVPLDFSAEAAKTRTGSAADVESKVEETLRDAAGAAGNAAKGAASDMKNTAKDAASDMKDTAKNAGSDMKDTAKDAASDLKNSAGEAASDIKDVLSEAEVFRFDDKKKN